MENQTNTGCSSRTCLIRTLGIGGYWTRDSQSFIRAARLLKARGVRNGAKVMLTVVSNDGGAYIDDYGAVCYGGTLAPNAQMCYVGVYTLGSVLRSNDL